MTDDTARRERAEKWAKHTLAKMEAEAWEWDSKESPLAYGYLAGALEEASAKDAMIETLRTTYDSLALHCTQREALLQSLIVLRNEQTTEIAALRERLATYQRALLFLYDSAYGRLPAEAVLDERWKIVKQLVSEVER